MIRKERIQLASRLCLAASVFLAACPPSSAQVPNRIKIAAFGSATGPNASTNFGNFVAVKMAIQEINRDGGIAGKPVDLVLADDQSDATAAVNEARRLVSLEKVNAVAGPHSSQYALAVAPIFNEAKVLYLVSAGSTALTAQVMANGFSMIPPADVQAQAMVNYATDVLKAKSIAWIGDDGAQARERAGVSVTAAKGFIASGVAVGIRRRSTTAIASPTLSQKPPASRSCSKARTSRKRTWLRRGNRGVDRSPRNMATCKTGIIHTCLKNRACTGQASRATCLRTQ